MPNTRTWVVEGIEDLSGRIIGSYYALRRVSILPPYEENSTVHTHQMIDALWLEEVKGDGVARFLPPTAPSHALADAKWVVAEEEEAKVDAQHTFVADYTSKGVDGRVAFGHQVAVQADGRVIFGLNLHRAVVSGRFAFATAEENRIADALFHFAQTAEKTADAFADFIHISDVAFFRDFLARYIPTLRLTPQWGASVHLLHPGESTKVLFPPQEMNKVLVYLRGYIVPVTITNSTAETLTNFQVPILLNTAALWRQRKMRQDCADIRVYAADKWTPLPFWVEKYTENTTQTRIWVKVPSIPPGTTTIYLSYGDLQATSLSNGAATFEFFEDFDSPLDPNFWQINSNDYTIANSVLRINKGAIGLKDPLPIVFNSGYILEGRVSYNSSSESLYSGVLEISSSRFTAGNNGQADATILYMTNSPSGDLSVRVWIGSGATPSYDVVAGAACFTATLNTWYTLGVEATPTTGAVWKDYSRVRAYTVSWQKNMRYFALGMFDGGSTADIKDTSYDWVRIRKFRLTPPSVSVGGETSYPYMRTLPNNATSAIITNQTETPTLVVALYYT